MNQPTPDSSSSRFMELGLFLKVHAWFIILASAVGMLVHGYVGINRGFDWTYLKDYQTYLNLVISMITWGFFCISHFGNITPILGQKCGKGWSPKTNLSTIF